MGSSRLPVSLRDTFATQPLTNRRRLLELNLDLIRNIVFALFVLRWTRKLVRHVRGYGLVGSVLGLYLSLQKTAYRLVQAAPFVRGRVAREKLATMRQMERDMIPTGRDVERHLALPKEGWSEERVRAELTRLAEMARPQWEEGKVSGTVYHGGAQLMRLQTEAFGTFTVANPLHPDVFPGVRKMEAEIVAMVLSLFNAPPEGAGITTSGGTESILMACFGARQKAYKERGITEPEMIVPVTAHAAFHKAADFFKIKMHIVPCPAPSYKVHIPSVKAHINSNTVLLVGSAPNYPHGIIDDISALSRLGLRYSIPLHVDCCLGSFLVPFLEKAGFESEPFDFRCKGVTSISCDTHKYGFAPKGNSTLLYRTKQLRAHQYSLSIDWTGGMYASPSIAGSRPGALIAGCWASLMSLGEAGYVDACHRIVGATRDIERAIREEEPLRTYLQIVGEPKVSVLAFVAKTPAGKGEPTLNVYEVKDAMKARGGWDLNATQGPPAVHVAVTLPIVGAAERLIEDLKAVVGEMAEAEKARIREGRPRGKGTSTAQLYGVAVSFPDKTIVKDFAVAFLDNLYKAKPEF